MKVSMSKDDGSEKEKGRGIKPLERRSGVPRIVAFLILAAALLGGVFVFWRYVYLPAELLNSLRRAEPPRFDAGPDAVPEFLLSSFAVARPILVDALLGDDEGDAAVAFVALRMKLGEEGVATLRRESFDPGKPSDPMFRLALLLEMEASPGTAAHLDFPPTFLSAYLKWKIGNREGSFRMPTEYFLHACQEILAVEGRRAAPFLLEVLRKSGLSPSEKLPLAVMVGNGPEAEDAYEILMADKTPPTLFLLSMLRKKSEWGESIMRKAFESGDPEQRKIALDYFMKFPDLSTAPLAAAILADPEIDLGLRKKIGASFLKSGSPWALEWIFENTVKWKGEEISDFLHWVPWSKYPVPKDVQRRLLLRWGLDGREGIPIAALNTWISIHKRAGYFPFGFEEVRGGVDPVASLEPVKRGLASRRTMGGREEWADRAYRGFRMLESVGRVDPNLGVLRAAAASVAEYFTQRQAALEESRKLRSGLARFLGGVLHRHGRFLEGREELAKVLAAVVANGEEDYDTRMEAAFWLARCGTADPEVDRFLTEGLADTDVTRRFACAAALGRLHEARLYSDPGVAQPSGRPLQVLRDAWGGDNPFVFFFAARETPNLPLGWMAEALPHMLRAAELPVVSPTKTPQPDPTMIGREALKLMMCTGDQEAIQKAKWLSENIPGGLTTIWADRVSVPTDPEGDVAVLTALTKVLEDLQNEPGKVRASVFLLRLWTGEQFGFQFLLRSRSHQKEIAERWRGWLEKSRDSLVWDAEADCFRVK
jgi:hypothetical protein